jgi:hypothetical protein
MKEVVFYAIVFVFSTLAIASALTALTVRTYYTFDMYFQSGIYNFTPSGEYYYYPSGSYSNVECKRRGRGAGSKRNRIYELHNRTAGVL